MTRNQKTMLLNNVEALIKKYDVPTPRYTSYPTVPCWDVDGFSVSQWIRAVERCFDESNESKGISVYIHLPFCESLCTYCACNTRITKNHSVEENYIHSVLNEWHLYRYIFGAKPVIRELHLGGGTPTFFSAAHLKQLISEILKCCTVHPQREFSFEGHPNNTTEEHLQVLYDLGFRRVSFGVQDMDEKVQQAIHRVQPFENVKHVVEQSRAIGYESVGFDLIYGLPWQTQASVADTFQKVIQLQPDRIAFYSYAHVPWIKPGQRGYEDADLPSDTVKRSLYDTGRALLLQAAYHDIGMDHFAKVTDPLYVAAQNKTLHRNFMGYTTSQTNLLIGLGASAISDAKYAYAQNAKKVEDYAFHIEPQRLAVVKGHINTHLDILIREAILSIACNGTLEPSLYEQVVDEKEEKQFHQMEEEGIVVLNDLGLTVTEPGRTFIRNICQVLDRRMHEQQHAVQFSKAI